MSPVSIRVCILLNDLRANVEYVTGGKIEVG